MSVEYHYLMNHPVGANTKNEILKRIRVIDFIILGLQTEFVMIHPQAFQKGYPRPDPKTLHFLRGRKNEYKSLLSAVNRVPQDVWRRIILSVNSTSDALKHAQVSPMWRTVILNAPTDFLKDVTVFVIPIINPTIKNPTIFKARLIKSMWNYRLSACLLDAGHGPESKHTVDLKLALRNTNQYPKALYMSAQSIPSLFGRNFLHIRFLWQHLEDLVIDCSNFPKPIYSDAHALSLEHLKSLRRLSIHAKGYLTVEGMIFPKELQYLHLDDGLAHSSAIMEALSGCDSLQTLILAYHMSSACGELTCYTPPVISPKRNHRILLPRLKYFVLIGKENASVILSYFQLPAVEHFRLACYKQKPQIRYPDTGNDIYQFIKASNCDIRRLELHSVSISAADMALCISVFQKLALMLVSDDGGLSGMLEGMRKPFCPPDNRSKRDSKKHPVVETPKRQVPVLVHLFVNTTSPSDWPQKDFDNFVQESRSEACMKRAELKYVNKLAPFRLHQHSQLADLTLFSSLQRTFGITLRAPYL